MKSIMFVVTLLIGILLGAIGCYAYLALKEKQVFNQLLGRENAYNYLVNSYNSTLGLCCEYPGSNRYWVTHDNVLASYALQNWNRTIAGNITETFKRIAKEYNLTTNSADIPLDTKAEVLLGYTMSFLSEFSNETELNSSYYGASLLSENATGVLAFFSGYADLLCYKSLNEWRRQNYTGAHSYYKQVEAMWDENGFKDDAYNRSEGYETYKLGMFYLLSKTLSEDFRFKKDLVETIWSCQVNNGGFKTHYFSKGNPTPNSKTNTETTSIILLADVPSLFDYDC